ncbi:Mov34/MPN/PAD-1 family protein [Deinococcus taklimakanensis]|uniref:Mov34/MPN/PAD-1 family protein n=1 Tax=Deinococcus taklimakanensis TaxID=536443 RepID=A0ABW5P420_9DEIO
MTQHHTFTSRDHRFQVALPAFALAEMVRLAQAAGQDETGGILVGQYTPDHRTALITRAEPPPSDSRSGPTWFQRGVTGVKDILNRLWIAPTRTYYLGEWHYHPHASASASRTDDHTMKCSELRDGFGCAEPILVILGGDPYGAVHLHAYVFPTPVTRVQLFEEESRGT